MIRGLQTLLFPCHGHTQGHITFYLLSSFSLFSLPLTNILGHSMTVYTSLYDALSSLDQDDME